MPSVLRTEGVIFGQTRGLSLHAGLQPELDLGYRNKVLVNVAFENLRGGVKTYVEV